VELVNVVVEFQHCGELKRFWYMPYLILDPRTNTEEAPPEVQSNFPIFAENLDFDTLLIKAANTWWGDCADPSQILKISLDPARKRDARVIADSNVYDPLSYGHHSSRPIWRIGYDPGFVDLNSFSREHSQLWFGYSSGTNFGDGKNLITAEDAIIVSEMEKRKLLSKIHEIKDFTREANKILSDMEIGSE